MTDLPDNQAHTKPNTTAEYDAGWKCDACGQALDRKVTHYAPNRNPDEAMYCSVTCGRADGYTESKLVAFLPGLAAALGGEPDAPQETTTNTTAEVFAEAAPDIENAYQQGKADERARIERIIEAYRAEHRHAEDRPIGSEARALTRQRIHACDHLLADIRDTSERVETDRGPTDA